MQLTSCTIFSCLKSKEQNRSDSSSRPPFCSHQLQPEDRQLPGRHAAGLAAQMPKQLKQVTKLKTGARFLYLP